MLQKMFQIRKTQEIKELLNSNIETMLRSNDPKERDEIKNTIRIVNDFLNGSFEIPFAIEADEDECTCDPTGLRNDVVCNHCQSSIDENEPLPFGV